ncbi:MAG: MFS transporter [Porticoccaceae bacterium]|nr:MFS transporter [Porticoccaceae bacterium]
MPDSVIRNPRYEYWRWRIFIITWLAYASFYFTRKAFAVAKIGIFDDPSLGLSKEMMANVDGVYLAAYALGQFVWGMLADRLGTRKVLLGGLLLSACASLVMGLFPSLLVFVTVMAFQGLAQSTGWSSCCKNMSHFFSRRERGRIMGFWSTSYAMGGLVGSPFAAWWAYEFFNHWRYAFIAPAIYLAIIWLLVFLFQRNRPRDVGLPSVEDYHGEQTPVLKEGETPEEEPSGSGKVIWEVLTNKTVLLLGAVYFLLKPARYAILFWGPFLVMEQVEGVSKLAAATVPVAFEVAGVAGPILLGYISDRFFQSRRMPPCAISLLLCTLALLAFMPAAEHLGVWGVLAVFFLIGLTLYGPDSMISGSAAIDFGTAKGAGTAAGLINGLGSVGAVFGGLLPGYVDSITLFYGFAGVNIVGALIMASMWNRVPTQPS